jgi:putative restriction endonuclease
MTPLERLRLEKAAADCGFEMSPRTVDGGLELRSAHFPEFVVVSGTPETRFVLTASNPILLDANRTGTVVGYAGLYEALGRASSRARTLPNRVADTFRAQTSLLPRSTEAERLIVERVGQGIFRSALLDYWQGRCCVTGLSVPQLLRASHIKPWAACETDDERLDVYNGLLLAPHLDALFDGGWLAFDDQGFACLSSTLPAEAGLLLGISAAWRVHGFTARHRSYLAHHRAHVFRDARS